ncbi:MAG: hypothetical protein A3E01_18185 [Gammaproteobacteria bacterium RIFCSPHIGHO2_12_FULL_63_22]|nr:MAG: hypothetical protein A3E01_18185 [Gammaproteobacteria bacterium RIFCSPHIGHO2_12_FULL_63_22]
MRAKMPSLKQTEGTAVTTLSTSVVAVAAPGNARPLDALAEVFVHLGDLANVNTNQILIVSGRLDPSLLEQSVQRAVAQIPLLRTRPAGSALHEHDSSSARWVEHREYLNDCDFGDPGFRHLLMDFSSARRLNWRDRPPLQLLLVTGGQNSCVYLSSHHGVADARSDCLLLRSIIDHYACLTGVPGAFVLTGILPFSPLTEIRPQWYRPLERSLRWARALGSVAVDLLRHDVGLRVGLHGQRWEGRAKDPTIGRLDFFQSLLPQDLERRLCAAARDSGVTVNTLLCAALARLMESSKKGTGSRRTLRITCAVSLRRLIDHSYDRSFRNYLVPSNIRLKVGQATPALVRSVHDAIDAARSERQIGTALGRLESLLPLLRPRLLRGLSRRLLNRCQGTNACYSNPGRIEEDFSSFGSPQHTTQSYVGFGCLVPPYDFILYTPTVNGRMQLDLVYRRAAFSDIRQEFTTPFLSALRQLLDELEAPCAKLPPL